MSELSFPISGVDLGSLEATHDLVKVDPSGLSHLSYSLVLPKGWVSEEDLGEQDDGIGQLMRIGLFADRVGPDATVAQVSVAKIPFEIDVRDWVEDQAAEFETELVYCQEVQFACGPVVDAGGSCGPSDNRQAIRLVAHADAARIFLVSVMTPMFRYDEQRNNIAIATNSFKLLKPSGSPQLEQWLDSAGGNPAFHVAYPASWKSRAVGKPIPGKSAVDILLTRENELAGYLRVKATDPAVAGDMSTHEALKLATEELQEGGVTLTAAWREDASPGVHRIEPVSGYLTSGRLGDKPVELRFALFPRGGLVFALSSISLLKSENPVLWMRS
ncbi:MAG TPA: hypothetical protein VNU44_21595, partial [Bryobacteraceae bacterium]|nr:hypothetical protein [Bryobacteraceae bacterium]